MVKGITHQRGVSCFMQRPPEYTSLIFSYFPDSSFVFGLVPLECHCSIEAHGAELMSVRWPFNVCLLSLEAALIDIEVKCICGASVGQSAHTQFCMK